MRKMIYWSFLVFLFSGCASRRAAERDQALVDELMQRDNSKFRQCYQEARNKNSSLEGGELLARLDHNPDGSFSNFRTLKSFSGAGPVAKCLENVVTSWRTESPYSRGPVDLGFDFELNDGGQAPRTSVPATLLTQEEINEVLQSNSDDFEDCYASVKSEKPWVRGGDLKFEFNISADGKVTRFDFLEGFDGSKDVAHCLSERSKTWSFTRTSESITAKWQWRYYEDRSKSSSL